MKSILITFLVIASSFSRAAAPPTDRLSNNAPIDIIEDESSPRQTLALVFQGGSGIVPKEQQGLTTVLTHILSEGPKGMTSDEFRKKQFLLNSSINFMAAPRAIIAFITTPQENLKTILNLTYEVLKNPKFDNATFELSHAKAMTSSNALFDNMRASINYFAYRDAFQFHPDVLDGQSTPRTLKTIQLKMIQDWYTKLVDFRKMSVATVGPASKWKVLADLQTIMAQIKKSIKNNDYIKSATASINPKQYLPSELKVAILNKPKATDNQILYIFPETFILDGPERLTSLVVHETLGGGLTGLLGKVLRVQRGLTYQVSSRPEPLKPYWTVYTFGGIFQTEGLLVGVPEQLEKFKSSKLDSNDIELSKSMVRTDFRANMELPEDRLLARLRLKMFDLDTQFPMKFENYLATVNTEEVEKFKSTKLNFKQGFLYIMGDKDQIFPALQKAGFNKSKVKVVELDELI